MKSGSSYNIAHKRIPSNFLPFMNQNQTDKKSSMDNTMILNFLIICIIQNRKLLRTSDLLLLQCIKNLYLHTTIIFPLKFITINFNLLKPWSFFRFRFYNWNCLSIFHRLYHKINLISWSKISEFNTYLIVRISSIILRTIHF